MSWVIHRVWTYRYGTYRYDRGLIVTVFLTRYRNDKSISGVRVFMIFYGFLGFFMLCFLQFEKFLYWFLMLPRLFLRLLWFYNIAYCFLLFYNASQDYREQSMTFQDFLNFSKMFYGSIAYIRIQRICATYHSGTFQGLSMVNYDFLGF